MSIDTTETMSKTFKFETHLHTAECDRVVDVPTDETVRLYKSAGYAGIVITNHVFSKFTEWFPDEIGDGSAYEINNRWLEGYRVAKREGDRIGMVILPGAEVRFDNDINDYLVYGPDADFFLNAPLLNRLGSVDNLISVLPEGSCVFQAHPFRERMVIRDPSPLFGIEIFNGGTEKFRNELAETYATHFGKPVISGSDYHHSRQLARGGICFEAKVSTPADFARVLRSGEYSLIENY